MGSYWWRWRKSASPGINTPGVFLHEPSPSASRRRIFGHPILTMWRFPLTQPKIWVKKFSTPPSSAPRRSEERRVGKECRYRWWPDDEKKKEKKEKRPLGAKGENKRSKTK